MNAILRIRPEGVYKRKSPKITIQTENILGNNNILDILSKESLTVKRI